MYNVYNAIMSAHEKASNALNFYTAAMHLSYTGLVNPGLETHTL